MRLKWLPTALRNLDSEASYLAEDEPAAARLLVKRVLATVSLLAEQPGLGRPGRVPGTPELLAPKSRFMVPYCVRRGTVEVLRVFYTVRQPPCQS